MPKTVEKMSPLEAGRVLATLELTLFESLFTPAACSSRTAPRLGAKKSAAQPVAPRKPRHTPYTQYPHFCLRVSCQPSTIKEPVAMANQGFPKKDQLKKCGCLELSGANPEAGKASWNPKYTKA